jgi:hypothetical protein
MYPQLKLKNYSQLEVRQLISELDDLHPLNFRLAFGLTHEEAAEELCIEAQTMRSYTKKPPSKRVRKLAATIAKKWIVADRHLVAPEHLFNAVVDSEALLNSNYFRRPI